MYMVIVIKPYEYIKIYKINTLENVNSNRIKHTRLIRYKVFLFWAY